MYALGAHSFRHPGDTDALILPRRKAIEKSTERWRVTTPCTLSPLGADAADARLITRSYIFSAFLDGVEETEMEDLEENLPPPQIIESNDRGFLKITYRSSATLFDDV